MGSESLIKKVLGLKKEEKEPPKLNKEQKEAINCVEGNLLILASAGTGKTTTIVERYANLIENHDYKPSEILMTTFTNKAAKDMIRKIVKRTGKEPPFVGTTHSLFLKILRSNAGYVDLSPNFTIVDDNDKKKIIRSILKEENIESRSNNISYFISWIGKFKNLGVLSETLDEEHSLDDVFKQGLVEEVLDDEIITIDPLLRKNVNKIYKLYDAELRKQNLVDFDDILLFSKKLLETKEELRDYYSKKFKAIMVDEAQDLNVVQIDLIGLLARNNLCVIGDDCQNIYEWRGSSPELVFNFNKNQKKITLEENYRSGKKIISSVNDIIKDMKFKIDKKLSCTRDSSGEISVSGFFNFEQEIDYILDEIHGLLKKGELKEDIAILFRTNSVGKEIERALRKSKIPCHLSRTVGFFEREEIRDITSFLRLKLNPFSFNDFERVLKLLEGFSKGSAESFKKLAVENACSLVESLNLPQKRKLSLEKTKKIQSFFDITNNFEENPLKQFLDKLGYLKILSKKYSEDFDKLEEKFENIETLKELWEERGNSKEEIRDFLDELIDVDKKEKTRDRIVLTTIHGAKGLEWKHVFLVYCNEGILPFYKNELSPLKRESELKLFYVAVSRAIDNLKISHSTCRNGFISSGPSSFLEIINKHTKEVGAF